MTSRPWWGTRPSDSYGLTRLEAAGGLTDDRLIRRLVWQTLTSQSFGPVGPKNILCDTDMTAHDDSVYSGGRDARRVYKGLSDPSHLRKKKKKKTQCTCFCSLDWVRYATANPELDRKKLCNTRYISSTPFLARGHLHVLWPFFFFFCRAK